MDSLSGKCQRMLIRTKIGNGYPNVRDQKIATEALLCAAHEQAIRTNYVKHYINKTSESPLCRLCGKKCESVQHSVCGCGKLAQKEYK